MRYRVAVVAASLIVVGGAGFVWHTQAMADERFEQFKHGLRVKQDEMKELPPWGKADVESLERSNSGVPLPIAEQTRLQLANLLLDVSFALVPMIFMGCLATAYFYGRLRR